MSQWFRGVRASSLLSGIVLPFTHVRGPLGTDDFDRRRFGSFTEAILADAIGRTTYATQLRGDSRSGVAVGFNGHGHIQELEWRRVENESFGKKERSTREIIPLWILVVRN